MGKPRRPLFGVQVVQISQMGSAALIAQNAAKLASLTILIQRRRAAARPGNYVLKVGETVLSAIVVGLIGAPVEPLDRRVPVLPHPVAGHVVVVVGKVPGAEPVLGLVH